MVSPMAPVRAPVESLDEAAWLAVAAAAAVVEGMESTMLVLPVFCKG
jgi:hypothetical protein